MRNERSKESNSDIFVKDDNIMFRRCNVLPQPKVSFLKIIFYWWCYYSCPSFPPLPHSTQPPALPQAVPAPVFMSLGHVYKFLAAPFPILYFTAPWLFCNYLFLPLNPLTPSPILPHPLPSGNHQNVLHIHDSVSVLVCLVCFFRFSCWWICIFCHFIVHSFDLFFFLNKSL